MNQLPSLGFIGLGDMGAPMVKNLVAAGYAVRGFDLNAERVAAGVAGGMIAGCDTPDVVAQSDMVLTSLPSSQAFFTVAENEILPNLRAGQIVIDLGTSVVPAFRALAEVMAERGVALVDAPVSGGPGGVERRQLYMFVGGSEEVVARCMPILAAIGGDARITHCGPVGSGQIVKGVNQLMMGLGNAAYLEALSFGVNLGVDAAVLQQALGNSGRWRADLHATAGQIVEGRGDEVGVKFRELPYFIEACQAAGLRLPLTELLYRFCDQGERVVIDDHRPAPSFWRELTGRP
ncbi:MAG: NAD(P)-dependent oxidoreductase [Caldilineaceae bacterium]|nr:NAD(P)-dependent oxidoreductase [Caldilineaceae bacterium]